MAKPAEERRRYKRLGASFPVVLKFSFADRSVETSAVNISGGGALVSMVPEMVPGCGTTVRLRLPASKAGPTDCSARVIRHVPLRDDRYIGVALQFDPPLPAQGV